jgi:signal transduction histidine kinase
MRQNARVLFDLEDSVVFMISAGKQALVGTAMSEQRQRLAEFSIPLSGGGNVAEAALKRNLIFLSRDRGVLSMPEEQLLRAFGAQCLLCLPICCGTRCLGLLVAGIEAWRVPDLQGQDKLLMAFANQAAAALDAAAKDRNEMAQRIAGIQEEHLKNSRKVVHEANNPLSIIKNYLGVLDDKLARQEPVSGELSILNDEIDRVGSIIKEFAGVAPPVPASGSLVDVNRVISDIVRLFRESRFLPPSVQISARLPKEPCEIVGTADTLKQIFVNLIKNAVEALPQGGHIEIVNLGQVRYDGADYFEISVRDSGPGLPQEVLAKLFSPVRSTKAGENRGLGLSIVHGLVKKLSGQIECRSSRMGTSFELRLPVRQAQVLA